jgi:hypothetical protein
MLVAANCKEFRDVARKVDTSVIASRTSELTFELNSVMNDARSRVKNLECSAQPPKRHAQLRKQRLNQRTRDGASQKTRCELRAIQEKQRSDRRQSSEARSEKCSQSRDLHTANRQTQLPLPPRRSRSQTHAARCKQHADASRLQTRAVPRTPPIRPRQAHRGKHCTRSEGQRKLANDLGSFCQSKAPAEQEHTVPWELEDSGCIQQPSTRSLRFSHRRRCHPLPSGVGVGTHLLPCRLLRVTPKPARGPDRPPACKKAALRPSIARWAVPRI